MDRHDYNLIRKLQAEKNRKDKEEYQQRLDAHDWWWFNSDSAIVRERGQKYEDSLKKDAALNPKLQKLYDKKHKSVFMSNKKVK